MPCFVPEELHTSTFLLADIEESLEHALVLRDRLKSVDGTKQARSLCSKVYPEAAGLDALPAAVDQLLGECSGE